MLTPGQQEHKLRTHVAMINGSSKNALFDRLWRQALTEQNIEDDLSLTDIEDMRLRMLEMSKTPIQRAIIDERFPMLIGDYAGESEGNAWTKRYNVKTATKTDRGTAGGGGSGLGKLRQGTPQGFKGRLSSDQFD